MAIKIKRDPQWSMVPKTPDDLFKLLPSKMWRLHNLYYITDEHQRRVLFRPRDNQLEFLINRHGFDVILKARQLGFSTAIQIDMLDDALFVKDTNAGVIAQSLKDAQEIFRTKIKFPYDNLPDVIKERIYPVNDSKEVLILSNGSQVRVGTSMRSSTLSNLHVSEYGKICAADPNKAREIRTGALNTVHQGQKIAVESTAEGREGHYYELCKQAQDMERSGALLTPLDFKFHFYPWWEDPKYEMDSAGVTITKHLQEYFYELESKTGIRLTREQKAWYAKKYETQQDDMKREFPSTAEEAFEQAIDGAYFAKQMALARTQKRIGFVPYDPSVPVNTFWDLGIGENDYTSIWFHQRIGLANHFIGYYENSGEYFPHYAKYVNDMEFIQGGHYLPHDSKNRDKRQPGTVFGDAHDLLRGEIYFVKRISAKQDAINAARVALQSCWFDAENAAQGIKCLDHYRKEWNEQLGVWRNTARHDEASHGADAFMTFATGYNPENDSSKAYTDDSDYEDANDGRSEITGY